MDEITTTDIVVPSAGVHIILPNYYAPANMGLIDPSTSDGRVIFFLPWQGNTIAGTITVSLTTLPADYQLSLINKDGATVLQSSTNAGTADESIGYNIPATGTYYVKVYPKNNGAFNAGSCYTLKVATGTAARMSNSIYVNSPLFLAPNPTSSKANLSFSLPTAGTGTLSVINQTGTVVLRKTIGVNAGDNSKEFDFSSLSSGIYFIRLQTAGNTQTTKLVITK